jgi:hypothetical protein
MEGTMASTKQKSYQTDERTEKLLDELREGFGVTTDSAVIRRALALASVVVRNADEDHTITLIGANNQPTKIILNG